jgi:hypothetical protein
VRAAGPLAMPIAAAAVTFSVVDAVVLKPLPFDAPDALLAIEHHRGDRVMTQARSLAAVEFVAGRAADPRDRPANGPRR